MAVFDIFDDAAMATITGTLEDIGRKVSEDKFIEIAQKIDDAMPGIIELITIESSDEWKSQAMAAKGWGSKYAGAIDYKVSGKSGEVFLDDSKMDKESNKPNVMFAMMMEDGVKSWSIKDALMKSDKVKVGPTGIKYITIPFPIATPRSKGQGKMASKFGKREMTQEMHKLVKSGGKLSAGTIKGVNVSGLQKYVTKKFHSQYGMFRRVSEKSQGWQYPGIGAQPIFSGVEKYVQKRMAEIMSDFTQAIVKEYS